MPNDIVVGKASVYGTYFITKGLEQILKAMFAMQKIKRNGSDEMIKIIVPLQPITKKNSQRILKKGNGQRFVAPSAKYKEYEAEAGIFITHRGEMIDCPVNVKCLFYMKTRRMPDLNNLLEAVTDMLVHYGVLKDDNANIVAAHDGSRVYYDKENPRTEILITEMEGGQYERT